MLIIVDCAMSYNGNGGFIEALNLGAQKILFG